MSFLHQNRNNSKNLLMWFTLVSRNTVFTWLLHLKIQLLCCLIHFCVTTTKDITVVKATYTRHKLHLITILTPAVKMFVLTTARYAIGISCNQMCVMLCSSRRNINVIFLVYSAAESYCFRRQKEWPDRGMVIKSLSSRVETFIKLESPLQS